MGCLVVVSDLPSHTLQGHPSVFTQWQLSHNSWALLLLTLLQGLSWWLSDKWSASQCRTAAATAKSLQLCEPIDGSPPGSPIPGILQARTLEWVAISFSNAWKWKVKVKSFSRVRLLATPWTAAHQAPLSMGFSRQGFWSGVPMQDMQVLFLHQEDPLEKEMATHSSILAWEIPWAEEPDWLQSMGPQKSWKWLRD